MFEEQISGKNRYIITFKKKEMRKDKEMDKTEILQQNVGPRLEFIDVGKQAMGFAPPDDPEGLMALDINDHELPMVFAALTDGEAGMLSKDANVAAVEPDGKIYAQGSQGLLSAEMPLGSSIGKDLSTVTPDAASEGPSAQADTTLHGGYLR